jgi:hypothetical protein
LFSIVFQVLALTRVAEHSGARAIVYLGREVCFWEEAGYNGARNAWEYFFEPVSSLALADVGFSSVELEGPYSPQLQEKLATRVNATNVYLWNEIGAFGLPNHTTQEQLDYLVEAGRRYLRVRPVVKMRAEAFYKQHFRDHVIGVHYRGTDKSTETPLLRSELYEQTIERLPRDSQIFVATDSAVFLTGMQARYGSRVIATDAVRSMDHRPVHVTGGAAIAEQGLIDALLLSRCSLMIHGPSNLPGGATIFNPSILRIDLCTRG